VAKQRDAYASGLYWHTDLEAAKVVAKATGKRILSLRLLGNLDDEFSCANSRFFRTALYANKEVADYLRQNYALHWKSVRPVPKLTIDMGDGRKIERTITGNSIHYVLNADGVVLDAVPGLYGPTAFVSALRKADDLAAFRVTATSQHEWFGYSVYHHSSAEAIQRIWLTDAVRAGAFGEAAAREAVSARGPALMERLATVALPTLITSNLEAQPQPPVNAAKISPNAREAAPLARGKGLVEGPILRRAMPHTEPINLVPTADAKPIAAAAAPIAAGKGRAEIPILRAMPGGKILKEARVDPMLGAMLPERMTPEVWKKLAGFRLEETKLDEASRRLMIAKLPASSVRAEERASGNVANESTPFAKTLRNFEAAMAEDTVRNEYLFHRQIHQWLGDALAGPALARDVEALNAKVYAQLFLTPNHDAWLGLVPDHVYSALDEDGGVCPLPNGK
jgi:hypothetical protein